MSDIVLTKIVDGVTYELVDESYEDDYGSYKSDYAAYRVEYDGERTRMHPQYYQYSQSEAAAYIPSSKDEFIQELMSRIDHLKRETSRAEDELRVLEKGKAG